MTRIITKRKYYPRAEGLERKELLSAGVQAHGVTALVRATPFMLSSPPIEGVRACGTGKGTIIITS
jgi:hypothetical protein